MLTQVFFKGIQRPVQFAAKKPEPLPALTFEQARERQESLMAKLGEGWNSLGISITDKKLALSLGFPSKANFDKTVNRLLEEGVFTKSEQAGLQGQFGNIQVYQYGDILVKAEVIGRIVAL